jgi:phage terminase large subunit GpA-like protein
MMMIVAQFSPAVCDVIRPKPHVSTVAWAASNVTLPRGSEIRGKVRFDLFPHAVEPLACFDDPYYRRISLQWASRLGKTIVGLTCLAKIADTNPNPQAFADADERSVRRVIKRLWQILEHVPGLEGRVPPERLRAADKCELVDSLIHGAWSGSPTLAADYAALVVVLNEIDKHSRRKSDEADFAELMRERAKGFVRHKIVEMSTPGYKGRSRIEAARLAGDNRRREVPCPWCNHWQTLRTGDRENPGGLKWDKPASGRSDPTVALETAWYECAGCRRKILDEHRYQLLNAGLWVPEGQTVAGSGRLIGKPARPGPHASFGPLSTLYSLLPSTTWGVYAAKFLESRGEREKRRNFCNSWEAHTWDPAPVRSTPHDVADRLVDDDQPTGVCPAWSIFLTRGVDVHSGGGEYHWQVIAWGPGGRSAAIDYGICFGDDDLDRRIRDDVYPHADGGRPLRPVLTLVDSGDGNVTEAVYAFCRRVPRCLPCKGSSHSRFAEAFRLSHLEDVDKPGQKRQKVRRGGVVLVIVNHERSQWWLQNRIDGTLKPEAVDRLTFPAEARVDLELWQQLLNEVPADETDDNGYTVTTWQRKGPQELRDAARYAWAAAQYVTNHGAHWNRLPARPAPGQSPPKPRPTTSGGMRTPDGRPFLITER